MEQWKEMNRLLFVVISLPFVVGCTLSLTNISTHGQATDLVDENQSASPEVSPALTVPVKAM